MKMVHFLLRDVLDAIRGLVLLHKKNLKILEKLKWLESVLSAEKSTRTWLKTLVSVMVAFLASDRHSFMSTRGIITFKA